MVSAFHPTNRLKLNGIIIISLLGRAVIMCLFRRIKSY
jgi:hypothetical protein